MICLPAERVRMFHKELIEETGSFDGVQDEELPDPALSLLFQTFSSQSVNGTVLPTHNMTHYRKYLCRDSGPDSIPEV